MISRLLFLLAAFLLLAIPVQAQEEDRQLADLDIEELMDVEVVTASRRSEPLSQVAGAVTVLDEEDIFRSGASSLPEVLKLVPGVHVAQVDTDKWAVGIRGFNGLLSNKHLVLIDGRPITSAYSTGVSWGNTLPISMVKRVEVVRGVWTSLWGADSFTGVINIITKTAQECQGGQSVTLAGTTGVEQTLRYGGKISENGYAMGYGNGAYKVGSRLTGDGADRSSENWKRGRGGFRADWTNVYTDSLSIQGDFTESKIEDGASGLARIQAPREVEHRSGFGQFVWERATGLDAGLKFRTSITHSTESLPGLKGATNVMDAEFQDAMEQTGIHRITWGVGSRYYWDDLSSADSISIEAGRKALFTANSFIQNRMTLIPDEFYLILGLKGDYLGQGVEMQPTMRLLHTGDNQEFWVALSRGVRSDNGLQREGSYSLRRDRTIYTVVTPGDLDVEKLTSYEAGYRRTMDETKRLDINVYVNEYRDLITFDLDSAAQTATLANAMRGTAYGTEAMLEWAVSPQLKLIPSASIIYQNLYGFDQLPSDESIPEEGWGSEIKLDVRSDLSDTVGADFFLGYIDSPDQQRLAGYFNLGGHLSWQATDTLLLELIARNLDGGHKQFSRLKVGPSLDLRMTWDF